MSGVIYPINDKKYTAEDVEIFNCTRTSGVYSVLDFDYSLSGNVLTVGKGLAWIKNGDFSGKAIAFKDVTTITLDSADDTLDRYDVVAVRYDATKTEPEIVVIKGTASETPTIPTRNTQSYLYELFLCSILRKAGESTVSFENVTDLRENKSYCGIMEDSVTSAVAPVYETLYEGGSLSVGDTVNIDNDKYAVYIATLHNTATNCNVVLSPLSGTNSVYIGGDTYPTMYFRVQMSVSANDPKTGILTVCQWGDTPVFTNPAVNNAKLIKLVGVTKQPKGYVKVDSVYNPESHNAQSGEAVKQAIDEALENFDFDIPENVETTDNKVTEINENSTDEQYPSAKATYDIFNKLLARLGLTMEDLEKSLPKVYITGDTAGISADNYVNVMCQYVNAYGHTEFTDYATIAWQGSSSLNFPVKNYKIKLFTDEEREEKSKRTFKDWHATNNYHLKANFGDCTNFMNNMMMHYLTKSYQYLEPLPRENARYTVDGFPILLYVNDEFSGIYFWNLKQDDKVYNLNEEKVDESGNVIQEADLCYQAGRADSYNNAGNNSCAFVYGALTANGKNFADAHAEIDYYWEDRVWDKVDNHPDVLYDTIQWVSEATNEDFKANLANYFDVDYLINYFVCMYTCGMIDSKAKNFNMLYFPEKGVWYPTFWDMDKAFGSGFNTGTVPYTIKFTPETSAVYEFDAPASRLFDKLIANFWEECCAKYEELRQTLFTVAQVEDSINAVWGNVTTEMITENKTVKYDGTSYTGFKTDGASFVANWAEQRFAFMDSIFTQNTEDVITGAYAQGYIDDTGNIVTTAGVYGIDYLPINNLRKIAIVSSNKFYAWRVAFYDENKNFVRRVVASNNNAVFGTTSIDVQNGEVYVRFSCNEVAGTDSSYTQGIFDNLCVVYPPEGEYIAVDTFDTYKTSYVENYTREYALVMLSDFRILGNSNIQVVANEGYQICFEPVFSNITSGYNDSDQLRNDVVLYFDTTDLTDVLTITNGWKVSGVRPNSVYIMVKKDDCTAFSIDDRPFFVVEGAVNK